jgi:Family of unknown function (DUF6886)
MASLYHFSEDPGIARFEPHVAATSLLQEPLVWAVDADHAHLYYFPRQCPRVIYYASARTSAGDVERFFGHSTARRVVAIESGWLQAMRDAALFRYEFDSAGFQVMDETAGYWVSHEVQTPLSIEPVGDLLAALTGADAEVHILPSLWPLYEAVIASTLEFSIIRWRNAAPRQELRSDA